MKTRKPRVATERATKHWRWWKKMVQDAERVRTSTLQMTDGDELQAFHAMRDVYLRAMRREPIRPAVLRNERIARLANR